ncbi:MAG: ABC transporter permease [Candidatus Kapabacteria bacterium]|nr:ABC transporter permease [Candidatus Kapabacteria bacterium]MDW8011627.1 ABC transporter permease [Bacteroidota bacterium]
MALQPIGQIALWEWRNQIRHWGFLLSAGLPVLLFAVLSLGGQRREPTTAATLAVWDETGQWVRQFQDVVAQRTSGSTLLVYPLVPEDTLRWTSLLQRVATGEWLGVLRLRPVPEGLEAEVWTTERAAERVRYMVTLLQERLRAALLRWWGIPEAAQQQLLQPLRIQEYFLPSAARAPSDVAVVVGLFLLSHALLWATRAITEERFSRVAELLLSIVPAQNIINGKFVGVVGIGVLQIAALTAARAALESPTGKQLWDAASLLLGYSFMASFGLWLASWIRSEAQLYGVATLVLFGLLAGAVFVLQSPEPLLPVMLAVPLWMPVVLVGMSPEVSGEIILGGIVSLLMSAALLRHAARGLPYGWGVSGSSVR